MEAHLIASSVAAAALVGFLGLPSYVSLGQRFGPSRRNYSPVDSIYEDEDGRASEDTQRQFSTLVPRVIALLAVLAGWIAALALAVLKTVGLVTVQPSKETASWLLTVAWTLLVIQGVSIYTERYPAKRYRLGILAFISSFLNLMVCAISAFFLQSEDQWPGTHSIILLVQLGLSLVAMIAFISIPRRPVLYSSGRPVDGEYTASFLGRMCFSWASDLIRRAEKQKNIEYSQLPHLPALRRAAILSAAWAKSKQRSRLWRTLFVAFRWPLITQFTIVSIKSIALFGPQFAMLKILQILEAPDEPRSENIWAWVCLLGGVMVVLTFLENQLYWMVW